LKPLTILMMHRKPYPCTHAMLETVYTRILPARGHRVLWMMPSGGDEDIGNFKMAEWNGTLVYLLRNDHLDNPIKKIGGRYFEQLKMVQHILEHEKVDIIQARTDWICGLVGVEAQRKWHVPFVYQDAFPMPEWWLAKRGWRKAVGWAWKQVEKYICAQAALVFPISQRMQQNLVQDGIDPKKMVVIPLGVDASVEVDEREGRLMRDRYGLGEAPVAIYFGEMGKSRQLDFLMRAFQKVLVEVPEARLLMVGKSAVSEKEVDWLKQVAKDLGVFEHTIFTGAVPRKDVPSYILAADISVSPIVPLPAYVLSSPTKLVESLIMGRPVVANDIPEQVSVIENGGGGIITSYKEEEFANGMIRLLKDRDTARLFGQKGKRYIAENRSYEILADHIEQAYATLSNRQG
jgi:glycosyltransferase involved in cell wall biosynthesis